MTDLTKKDLPDLKELKEAAERFGGLLFDYSTILEKGDVLAIVQNFATDIKNIIDDLENDYWTFYDPKTDEIVEGEDFESKDELIDYLESRFEDEMGWVEGKRNGDIYEQDFTIVNYKYSKDERGDMIILSTEDIKVQYEHYHGDLAEHGTWGR